MRTTRVVFLAVFLAILVGASASAQTRHEVNSVFNPSKGSSTALVNCGVTDEQLTTEGYTHKVTFPAGVRLVWVEGCRNDLTFRDRHGHPVAEGTVGYLKAPKSAEVAFVGTCRNRGFLNMELEADQEERVELESTPEPDRRVRPPHRDRDFSLEVWVSPVVAGPVDIKLPPPPSIQPKAVAKKGGFPWKPILIGGAIVGACVASWQTGFPVPCGWIGPGKKKLVKPKGCPQGGVMVNGHCLFPGPNGL